MSHNRVIQKPAYQHLKRRYLRPLQISHYNLEGDFGESASSARSLTIKCCSTVKETRSQSCLREDWKRVWIKSILRVLSSTDWSAGERSSHSFFSGIMVDPSWQRINSGIIIFAHRSRLQFLGSARLFKTYQPFFCRMVFVLWKLRHSIRKDSDQGAEALSLIDISYQYFVLCSLGWPSRAYFDCSPFTDSTETSVPKGSGTPLTWSPAPGLKKSSFY